MSKLDDAKHFESFRERLVQAKKERDERIRAMLRKYIPLKEGMTLSDYIKSLKENRDSTDVTEQEAGTDQ